MQIKGLVQLSSDFRNELDENIREIQPKFDMLRDLMLNKLPEVTKTLKRYPGCTRQSFKEAQGYLEQLRLLNYQKCIEKGTYIHCYSYKK